MKHRTRQQMEADDRMLIEETLAYLKRDKMWNPAKRLILNTHLETDGEVRRIINLMRREGCPIVGSSYGYKYTENKDEIALYLESLKGRIMIMREAYNGLMDYLDLYPGQDSQSNKYNWKKD